MKTKRSFLTILALILAGDLVVLPDCVAAKKGDSTRKSTKSKSSSKSKSSKKSNESSVLNVRNEDTSRRGSSNTSSSSTVATQETTTTVVMDEATQIQSIADNLKANCLRTECRGSIDYEKCFRSTALDNALMSPACSSYLKAASSTDIAMMAKNKVKQDIQSLFKSTCSQNGGKINGESCSVDVYFYAKFPGGKKTTISKKKTANIGSNFTCDLVNFGLTDEDLEYKPEKSAEQTAQEIQMWVDFTMGAVNTTSQAISAHNAEKELKKANAYAQDAWYEFDGKSLSQKEVCAEYYYGEDGTGMNEKEWNNLKKEGKACATDGEGTRYCKKLSDGSYARTSNDSTYESCKKKYDAQCSGSSSCPLCSAAEGSLEESNKCAVFIEKSNEIKERQKLSELIRTKMDLNSMKANAEQAQMYQNLRNTVAQAQAAQMLSNLTGSSSNNQESCHSVIITLGQKYDKNCSLSENGGVVNSIYDLLNVCSSILNTANRDNDMTFNPSKYCKLLSNNNYYPGYSNSTVYSCLWDMNGYDECTWDTGRKEWVRTVSSDILDNKQINKIKTAMNDISGGVDCKDNTEEERCKEKNTISKYNSTLEAYNSNQSSLNSANKKIEELEEQQSSASQEAWSTGTQTVMGLVTGLIQKGANDKIRSRVEGACFVGNPEGGDSELLGKEGETRKINWK